MNGLRKRLRAFGREEDGALLIFAMFLLFLMLVVGGFAIDVMRYERERTKLQFTADRAVLAAASLSQTQNPHEVVQDYFEKAGLGDHYQPAEVAQGLNFREVGVRTSMPISTMFMRAVGVNTLEAPAAARASEVIPNVEVSLVLDISGSMRFVDQGGMRRIDRLRPAARRFVDRLLSGDRAETTSISIVPYAGQVNPGQAVFNLVGGEVATISYTTTVDGVMQNITRRRDHPASHCLEFPASAFDSGAIPTMSTFEQSPHFMYWPIHNGTMDWGWCPLEGNPGAGESSASILYFSSNAELLRGYIDRIRLHDGTGTHYGMLWGWWLLDPANRWLTQELVDVNVVHSDFANRPADYEDEETIKVIVLMTDGFITQQVRPRFPDRTLPPLNHTAPAQVDLHHTLELQRQNRNNDCNGSTCHTNETNAAQNRARFFQACDAAKAAGIVIYTIAFDTTVGGRAEMQQCATSVSHYYDAGGADLDTAFQAIASSIQQLRLTE